MTPPLVLRHGAAETVFMIAVLVCLRHPSCTGIALVLLGITLACDGGWALLVVAVLGGVGLYVRIRAGERQLTQALGAGYERFAAGRKRLVPAVW